jgi:hypothetical protein
MRLPQVIMADDGSIAIDDDLISELWHVVDTGPRLRQYQPDDCDGGPWWLSEQMIRTLPRMPRWHRMVRSSEMMFTADG